MGEFNVRAFNDTKNKLTINDIGIDNILVVDTCINEKRGRQAYDGLKVVTKSGRVYSARTGSIDFDNTKEITPDIKFTEMGTVNIPKLPTNAIVGTSVVDVCGDKDHKSAIYLNLDGDFMPIICWLRGKEIQTNYYNIAVHFNHELADVTLGLVEETA